MTRHLEAWQFLPDEEKKALQAHEDQIIQAQGVSKCA
jgi:hypothetical protein